MKLWLWLFELNYQANHRVTTRTQRRIYGHATDVEIRPLNEEKAVQAAVDLIGEVFVFTVLFFNPESLFLMFEEFVLSPLVLLLLMSEFLIPRNSTYPVQFAMSFVLCKLWVCVLMLVFVRAFTERKRIV